MDSEDQLVNWLLEATHLIVFTGAGISAESGVPTFRGSGGLWEGHRVEDVASPMAFRRKPKLVWRFYAERQAALVGVEPNSGHLALAQMEAFYPEFLLITQNVDQLHERAGSRKLVKLHGSIMEARCTICKRVAILNEPVPLAKIEAGKLPLCRCLGLQRPNVVWFREPLNSWRLEEIRTQFQRLEYSPEAKGLLLVIGTSGVVSGGYGMVEAAQRLGARVVEINPEPSALSDQVDLSLREPAGLLLERVWKRVLDSRSPPAPYSTQFTDTSE